MRIYKSERRFYVPARGLATALSLLFAFFYSKELGVLNRSYVAVIMTLSVLIIILITSGTTLTLRNLPMAEKTSENLSSFFSLIELMSVIGLVLFCFFLFIFSIFRNALPHPFIIASIIYFISSLVHLVSMEILIAFDRFKRAGKYEIFTIFLQLFFYFVGKYTTEFSIANRLFLSLSASYLIIAILCYIDLRPHFVKIIGFHDPRLFLRQTRGNHSIGTVLGMVDRFDRLIIVWFLPVILLGKYTIMSSFISFFRFIPDAMSKILVSSKSEAWRAYLKKPALLFIALASLVAVMILTSQLLINHLLGPEWLLPWGVSFMFALQELARGAFQLSGNYRVSVGSSSQAHKAALILLFTATPLSIVLSRWQGLIGVPLGFFITYAGLLLYMKSEAKHE